MLRSPIKVLFIVNSLGFGGAEKHVISLANGLAATRYRSSLAYLKEDQSLLAQIDPRQIAGGIMGCAVARRIDRRAVSLLARQIDAEAIELIVCVNPYALLYGCLAKLAARSGCRIVELFHSTTLGSLGDQLQMCFYRPFIRYCDLLVYVCDNQRRYWRARLLRARADAVIHNGIDVARYVPSESASSVSISPRDAVSLRHTFGLTETDYVVGLCAAMRPEKAHGDLLQAIAGLKQAGLTVNALLIGDGPQRAQVERQIDFLGIRAQVIVTGFMEDVRPAIAACDVMTLVSHHVETFSIAALEAMAMGKPLIMSDIGGAAEQVCPGENGYLFAPGDLAGLTMALRRLADRTHAAQLGARARAIVEQRFSLADMVKRYDSLFAALLEPRGVSRASIHVG